MTLPLIGPPSGDPEAAFSSGNGVTFAEHVEMTFEGELVAMGILILAILMLVRIIEVVGI
jgi:hypothetical protein